MGNPTPPTREAEFAEASEKVATFLAMLDEAEAEQREAERKIGGLRTILDGYVTMYPELASEVGGRAASVVRQRTPRGQGAARLVLMASPGASLTVSQVVAELSERGWLPDSTHPTNAVRAALDRLTVWQGDVEKVATTDGRSVAYRYMGEK